MPTTAAPSALTRIVREKDGNCFLWGCVTLVVVFLIGTVVAFGVIRYGIERLRETFTDDTPMDLPLVQITESDLDELIERVDSFADALREEVATDPLTLTQDDLNALIQNHPEVEEWGEYVYFTIEEDQTLNGQVSVPLDFLPSFGGRYFNGSAEFEAGIENGRFTVFVNGATLNGEPVPEELLNEVRSENLAADFNQDSDAQVLFEKVDSLVIQDGVIRITPRAPKETVEEEADPAEATP